MLRKIDLGCIDPAKLDAKTSRVLLKFLRNQIDWPLIYSNVTHHILMKDLELNDDVIYVFELTNSVLARNRKPGKRGQRHEVIEGMLGEGGQGSVLHSKGVICTSGQKLAYKPKERAIKKQPLGFFATREYEHSKIAEHLGVKKPVLSYEGNDIYQYMVMRNFTGDNLHEVLCDESDGLIQIDTDLRIELSLMILRTIQKEAHQLGMIHLDIKSENIMLDFEKLIMHLIDYATCKFLSDPEDDPGFCGSYFMQPAEQFTGCPATFKKFTITADSFTTGKTIGELWHAISDACKMIGSEKLSTQIAYHRCFLLAKQDTKFDFTTFIGGDLSDEHAAKIKEVIEQLTRALPENRWHLDQAIQVFEQIKLERAAAKSPAPRLGF